MGHRLQWVSSPLPNANVCIRMRHSSIGALSIRKHACVRYVVRYFVCRTLPFVPASPCGSIAISSCCVGPAGTLRSMHSARRAWRSRCRVLPSDGRQTTFRLPTVLAAAVPKKEQREWDVSQTCVNGTRAYGKRATRHALFAHAHKYGPMATLAAVMPVSHARCSNAMSRAYNFAK